MIKTKWNKKLLKIDIFNVIVFILFNSSYLPVHAKTNKTKLSEKPKTKQIISFQCPCNCQIMVMNTSRLWFLCLSHCCLSLKCKLCDWGIVFSWLLWNWQGSEQPSSQNAQFVCLNIRYLKRILKFGTVVGILRQHFCVWKLMSFSKVDTLFCKFWEAERPAITIPALFLVCFRCKLAQANGWGVMVSHRSGETEDTFIADLVVGLCTGQVIRHRIIVHV